MVSDTTLMQDNMEQSVGEELHSVWLGVDRVFGQTGDEHILLECWVRLVGGMVVVLEMRVDLRPFGGGALVAPFCAKPLV